MKYAMFYLVLVLRYENLCGRGIITTFHPTMNLIDLGKPNK